MSCDDLAIVLTEAALDEGAARDPALLAHVERCSACRDDLAALRRTVDRIRGAAPALAAEDASTGPRPASRIARALGASGAVAAAAILAALAIATPLLLAHRAPRSAPAPSKEEPRAPEPAPSPADPRLLEPEAPVLMAGASADSLALVERELARSFAATSDDSGVAEDALDESTDLLIARLDGPSAERALALLGH